MSWQLLCQYLSSHAWQRGCFSNWIQNIKLVVLAVYIAPFLSQSNKTLPNTCLASEPYSLPMVSLETFQSGWFHECIMHQQKQLSLASINLALFHAAAFMLSAQKEALCVMFKPMAIFKGDLQTKTQPTIDNNKSAFLSAILLLPEFHCSCKLFSIVSRFRPLPASRLVNHVTKTQCFSAFFINNGRLHQIVWQGAITTT